MRSTARRARRVVVAAIATVALAAGTVLSSSAASAVPTSAPPPTIMAALGDSISQAAMTCPSLTSCPASSWTTGSAPAVNSHFTRLRATSPTLVAFNNSTSGAGSATLFAQAQKAVTQGAQYVTIEIGANDACTKTVAAMTPTATFKANIVTALNLLKSTPAQPEVFLASIPNLQRMYDLNKANPTARLAWALLQTCQSMLANPTSAKNADVQRRAAVQQRVDEYNNALFEACRDMGPKCRWDGGVVANYAFAKTDVSTRDYFHPSLAGQTLLANITWPLTQWQS